MSDQNQPEQQPVFNIQRVYLKDMSLEQPNSPAIFLEQEAPGIEVQLDIGSENLAEGIYEATVTITVTAKIRDKVACPNIIYPYLRANIADTITRAGFPPIHLTEINFEVFYHQRREAMAQAATQQVQ
jgi:preprotein translocase subunit SecB